MHTPRKDAAGADSVGNHGDTAAPAARAIDVVRCPGHPAAVDVIGSADSDPIHLGPAQWAEFIAAVKAGKYDGIAGRS